MYINSQMPTLAEYQKNLRRKTLLRQIQARASVKEAFRVLFWHAEETRLGYLILCSLVFLSIFLFVTYVYLLFKSTLRWYVLIPLALFFISGVGGWIIASLEILDAYHSPLKIYQELEETEKDKV